MNLTSYRPYSDSEWCGLSKIFAEPALKWVSADIEGQSYVDMPLLLDCKGRVLDAPTSWLTAIRLNSVKRRTAEKYSYALRLYWTFLGPRDWTRPDDALLREWRNKMKRAGKSGARINTCIDVVVTFFVWAQDAGLIVRRIGATPPGGSPYPVRLVPQKGRGAGFVSVVRADVTRKPRLPVPDIADVDQLYERLTSPDEAMSERNCAMADLAVQCGLRRDEFNSLNVGDIPSRADISKCKERQVPCFISVIGKGDKARDVPMLPELAERLRLHIEGGRKELLGPSTRDCGALFLSRKTGGRLTEWWVSRLFSRAFGGAKREKLTLHRLRARFASLLVLTLARREMERRSLSSIREDMVLMAAAEVLGHGNIATLERYVDLALRTLHAEATTGQSAHPPSLGVDVEVLEEVSRQHSGLRSRKPASAKRAEAEPSPRNRTRR